MTIPRKGIPFGWSVPTQKIPDDYFQPLNVWHIAFGKFDDLLLVELSDKVLVSNDHATGLHEDEGGPLSYEPDETIMLYSDVLQAIIPDGSQIGCRTLDLTTYHERFIFSQLGANKSILRGVFTRFGVDPDSIVDYVFVGDDPATHQSFVLLEAAAKRMDLFLWEFWYANKMADTPRDIIVLLHDFEIIICGIDNFVLIITSLYSKEEIKKILQEVAESYGLRLPVHDYVLV